MKSLNLLIIEDNEEHAHIVSRYLSRAEGFDVHLHRESLLRLGLAQMLANKFDAVLLDLRLPDSELHETLARTVATSVLVPIIVLSSLEDRDSAIKAVQEGASDYLCKSALSSELLIRTVLNSMRRKETEALLRKQSSFNHTLYELSQFALSGSSLQELRNRISDSLKKSLDIQYVEFVHNLSIDASKLQSSDPEDATSSTSVLANLEVLGLDKISEKITFLGLNSGLNLLVKEAGEQTYLLILAYSLESREFSSEENFFVLAVGYVYSAAMERKALQNQLQIKIKDLHEANQKKDDFLATLSHELRTPLNIISGYLEFIRGIGIENASLSRAIEKIEDNVRSETKLISDILDLSRIITGKMTISPESFDLNQLVRSTIEAIGFASNAKKINVKLELDPKVGSFLADANRLRQAMWNLLSNAVKFTPNQGEIIVQAGIVDSDFVFIVKDSGRGISKENLAHVFDRFWQEDTSMSRTYMGLGLGLGIVRHIVELHGGEVLVSSAGRDNGSMFKFTIPVQSIVLDKEAEHGEELENESSEATHSLKDFRILVIDDSEDTLALMNLLLTKEGARVVCANTPQEGLKIAEKNSFDVVLSDIGMPEINGYDLMKRLRQWEKENLRVETPSIALTAYVADDDIKRALECGFNAHLGKPTNIKVLKQQIHKIILTQSQSRSIAG